MALLFLALLLLYFVVAMRPASAGGAALSQALWTVYALLGLSGLVLQLLEGIPTVFPPNWWSTLYLSFCILICIWAFRSTTTRQVERLIFDPRVALPVENILIVGQLLSIAFFLPFAISALVGDPGLYRLQIAEVMETLASSGLVNTVAGLFSHLFGVSLVLALLRLAPDAGRGRSVPRALLLLVGSLSWVIYVLAYAGRDGVVYWLLTAAALVFLFRRRLPRRDRSAISLAIPVLGAMLLAPMVVITISRFFSDDGGGFWSLFEYFGAQIQNFSDYSSLEGRPITDGLRTLPLFHAQVCALAGLDCATWPEIQSDVFEEYLLQGKEPWLFGTFVSDFVGDFGMFTTLLLVLGFALFANAVTAAGRRRGLSLSRLLFILLLFQVPYWGVFYFRFSIVNSYLLVNAAMCMVVFVIERIRSRRVECLDPLDGQRRSAP